MFASIKSSLRPILPWCFGALGLMACGSLQLVDQNRKPNTDAVSVSGSLNEVGGFQRSHPVVLLSDFGTLDDGIAICKGVMLKIQPNLTLVDITHQVPAFSVKDAARFLANSSPYFPEGTVFLALVERHGDKPTKPVVVKTKKGQYFVLPDNGMMTLVEERDGIEAIRVISQNPWLSEKNLSSTFMGRDLYAPVAAHLARGEDWTKVGPVLTKLTRLDLKTLKVSEYGIVGEVIALDGPFGNLITNVTSASFLNAGYGLGDTVTLTLGGREFRLPFVKTYDDVPINTNLIYIDSTDHLALAVNQGNFASRYKIKPPTKLVIVRKKKVMKR